MKTRTNFDPPSDPYGDEVHCHICDACMVQNSGGEWECLQYHADELQSQDDHKRKQYECPYCGSHRTEDDDLEPDTNGTTLYVRQPCICLSCHARWKEVFKWECYEMIGEK